MLYTGACWGIHQVGGVMMMDDFVQVLPAETQRKIRLLNLFRESTGWLGAEEISKAVNCSRKTVVTDCEYLGARWPEVITFEASSKSRFLMRQKECQSLQTIYRDMIRESKEFSILEGVFFEPGKTGAYWCEKDFLSPAGVYRIAKKLDASLERRNLRLHRAPYEIAGEDERQIRCFFGTYFFEVYGISKWPFPLDKDLVYELVGKLTRQLRLDFSDFDYVGFTYSIVVALIREAEGKLLPISREARQHFQKRMEIIRKFTPDVKRILGDKADTLPGNWYEDFTCSIFWWEFSWDSEVERRHVFVEACEMVDTIRQVLDVYISEESRKSIVEMLEGVYISHKLYPYRRYVAFTREFFSCGTIEKNFAFFSAVVKQALKLKEREMRFPWYSYYYDEILYRMMILWENLPDYLSENRRKVKIAVFSDLGAEHARLLGVILQQNFPGKIRLQMQEEPFHQMKGNPFQHADLNVTNIHLEGVPDELQVIVEDIPTFRNLVDLRVKIDGLRIVVPRDLPFLNQVVE